MTGYMKLLFRTRVFREMLLAFLCLSTFLCSLLVPAIVYESKEVIFCLQKKRIKKYFYAGKKSVLICVEKPAQHRANLLQFLNVLV